MNSGKQRAAVEVITQRNLQQKNSNMTECINENDKVRLNVKRLKRSVDWKRMTNEYKRFVETNQNTVFTAHLEGVALVSMKEDDRWLFYVEDVIKHEE